MERQGRGQEGGQNARTELDVGMEHQAHSGCPQ